MQQRRQVPKQTNNDRKPAGTVPDHALTLLRVSNWIKAVTRIAIPFAVLAWSMAQIGAFLMERIGVSYAIAQALHATQG